MYLGIDLGTSEVKAVLLDERQQALASAAIGLAVSRPRPQWAEQDPHSWWQAVCDAIDLLRHDTDLSPVRGIGVSGQMHGATVLDSGGQVLRPAILWNDMRSEAECT